MADTNFSIGFLLIPQLPHCLAQILQDFTPWVHSWHIFWNKFCKGFPLRAVSVTLDVTIFQGVITWGRSHYMSWKKFQCVSPWGHSFHIVWHNFFNGLPLKALADTWSDTSLFKGNSSSVQICHMWCHIIFQAIICMELLLKHCHTFFWFIFGFSLIRWGYFCCVVFL